MVEMEQLLKFIEEKVPHSGKTLQAKPWVDLEGPIFRLNVVDTPLHKKGFDEGCLRCNLDKLVEDMRW